MRSDAYDEVEVARGCTAGALATLPAQPDPLPVDHPGRYGHVEVVRTVRAGDGQAAMASVVGLLDG